MTPLDIAVWHLTGALRNVQLHRRAFCHAARYPRRGRWVNGTKWPDLEGCAKCQRTLRRVSYAWAFAAALCDLAGDAQQRADRIRQEAKAAASLYVYAPNRLDAQLHADLLRTAPGRMTPYTREWLAGVAEAEDRQGSPDAGQALPPESPTTV